MAPRGAEAVDLRVAFRGQTLGFPDAPLRRGAHVWQRLEPGPAWSGGSLVSAEQLCLLGREPDDGTARVVVVGESPGARRGCPDPALRRRPGSAPSSLTSFPAVHTGPDEVFCSIEKTKGSIWLKKF